MKGSPEGDDSLAAGDVAGQLDGPFHRFGSGVAEEEPVEAKRSNRGQKLRSRHGSLVVINAAGVAETGQLPCYRRHDPGMVVADIQGAEARGAVQVTFSLHVCNPAPFAPLDGDRMIVVEGW